MKTKTIFFSYGLQKIILKIYVKIKILLNLLNYKMTQWMMKCHKSNMKMKLVDVTKMNTLWFCADRKKNYSIWMNWERIKGFMVNPINRVVLKRGVRLKVANRQNVFSLFDENWFWVDFGYFWTVPKEKFTRTKSSLGAYSSGEEELSNIYWIIYNIIFEHILSK